MKVVTKKNEKEIKRCVMMFNFPLTKNSQQRMSAGDFKTPMKSNIVSMDPMFACFYQISRKQRLLVETLYVN